MIRLATENRNNNDVSDRVYHIQGAVERMEGIARETYDLVISRNSLHHWDDSRRAFEEISRVLKVDGKVCNSGQQKGLRAGREIAGKPHGFINSREHGHVLERYRLPQTALPSNVSSS